MAGIHKKKRVCAVCNQTPVTQPEHKNVERLRRGKTRSGKAQLELHLATAVQSNKKHFYTSIGKRRRAKGNLQGLLAAVVCTDKVDEEKA